MKLVVPIDITDTNLMQINVPEDDAGEWAAGQNYGVGDRCMVILAGQNGSCSDTHLQYHRANLISGNAFVEINDTNITAFVGTDYGYTPFGIELTDENGYTALGYLAGGGDGRVLGSNLIQNGNFATNANWIGWGGGWTWYGYGARGINASTLYQNSIIEPHQLYFAKYLAYNYQGGMFGLFYGDYTNELWSRYSNGSFEEFGFTNAGTRVGIQQNSYGNVSVDDIEVRKVTEPTQAISGGCHVVSEIDGTFRRWNYIHPSFNGRTIAQYRIFSCGSTKYHKVYESLRNNNKGNFPPSTTEGDVPWWLELGSTNKWRLFDNSIGSQTTYPNTISAIINPVEEFDSVVLFNLDGDTIELAIQDGPDLTTNGSFDQNASWTREAGWTIIPVP